MHKPELIKENIIIKAVISFIIGFSEILHKLIQNTSCLREDDYAYSSINFDIDCAQADSLLLKAEKTIENEDILVRLKFFRGFYNIINNLLKPDGFIGAESFLLFTLKQFSLIKEKSPEDVSCLFDKNYCLKKIPHFLPNKIYNRKDYDFTKALFRISSFLKSVEYLIKLKDINDLDELFERLNNLPSFDILSRMLYESVLFSQISPQIMLFSKTPLKVLIVKNLQKFGVDTEFLLFSDVFLFYLSRIEIVFKEYILLRLKNKPRQQRILTKYLSDFNILTSEGNYLIEEVYGNTELNSKPEKLLLFL